MRLIHTKNFQLVEFGDKEIPKYTILSHTWDREELSYEDIRKQEFQHKAAFAKLKGCCTQALKDGFDWIWVDTCCIDKSSSAELSESINSMYRYYRDSSICYVYFADCHSAEGLPVSIEEFKLSRWWSRGWTLQELIAPRRVQFYSSAWKYINDKHTLANLIHSITGIPRAVLNGASPGSCNVAQRMSWAAGRETTRNEDIAYCLIGLFDIQMVPIYGEGATNAFLRLEEEVLKRTADHTLFLWTPMHEPYNQGLLATSPKAFCKHTECFDWVARLDNKRSARFYDPYECFQPWLRGFQSLSFNNTGAVEEKGNGHGCFPALGAHGVQGNFLMEDSSDPESLVQMLCLDVKHNIDLGWRYVGLNLRPEFALPSCGLPNRAGYMRRACAADELSIPVLHITDREFQRKTLAVSQINAPDVDSDLKITYSFGTESLPFLKHVIDMFFEGNFTKNDKEMMYKQNVQPGALVFRHHCTGVSLDSVFAVIFGSHNIRQTFWCTAPRLSHIEMCGHRIDELEKIYMDTKLSSGRFREKDATILSCRKHAAFIQMSNQVIGERDRAGVHVEINLGVYEIS
jgi:Heterokaryon incompatibility protein (HET)